MQRLQFGAEGLRCHSQFFRRTSARFVTTLLLGLVVPLVTGCGGGEAAKKIAAAQAAMQQSLEAWKNGQAPATLQSAAPPISFFDDDWQRGAALQQFQVVKTYVDSDGMARCTVELTVRRPNGATEQRKLTYQVAPKDQQLVIAIDPFS